MTQKAAFESVVARLKNGNVSKKDAQILLDAFSSWADKRLPGDEWDEVVTLERSLFGRTLQEKEEAA